MAKLIEFSLKNPKGKAESKLASLLSRSLPFLKKDLLTRIESANESVPQGIQILGTPTFG